MRLLLALILVNGLVPGFGEIVESVVHYAADGHLAHSDADHGDKGHEHGCGTTEHLCSCCTSLSVVVPVAGVVIPVVHAHAARPSIADGLASLDAPSPPHRPPIAS